MCGRYTLRRPGQLAKLVHQDQFAEFSEIRLVPKFSPVPKLILGPATPVPIIRFNQARERVLGLAEWAANAGDDGG